MRPHWPGVSLPPNTPMPQDEYFHSDTFAGGFDARVSQENTQHGSSPLMADMEVTRDDRLVRAPGVRLTEALNFTPTQMFLHAGDKYSSEILFIAAPFMGVKRQGNTLWADVGLRSGGAPYVAGNFAGVMLLSDGVKGLYYRRPRKVELVQIKDAPAAFGITTFAGRVLLGGTLVGSNMDFMGLGWSDATNDYQGWDYSNGAGAQSMISNGVAADRFQAFAPLGFDTLAIVNRRSIWIGVPTGDSFQPVRFSPRIESTGAIAAATVIPSEFGVMFLADDGLRLFDGNTCQVLSDQINPELLPVSDGTLYTASLDPTRKRYYLHTPTETWVFDILKRRWFKWNGAFTKSVFFPVQAAKGTTWGQMVGTWGEQTKAWWQYLSSEAGGNMVFVRNNLYGFEDPTTFNVLSSTLQPEWYDRRMVGENQDMLMTGLGVRMTYEADVDSSVEIWLPDKPNGNFEIVATAVLTAGPGTRRAWIPLIHTGRGMSLGIKITSGNPRIRKASVEFQRTGLLLDMPYEVILPTPPSGRRDDIPALFIDSADGGEFRGNKWYEWDNGLTYLRTDGFEGGGCYRTINGRSNAFANGEPFQGKTNFSALYNFDLNGIVILSDGHILWQFMDYDTENVQVCVSLTDTYKVQAHRGDNAGDVLLGLPSAFAFSPNAKGHLEIIVRIDPTDGAVIVRYVPYGSTVSQVILDLRGLNTVSDGSTNMNVAVWSYGTDSFMTTIGAFHGGADEQRIDDIAILDRTGIPLDDYTGFVRSCVLIASAAGVDADNGAQLENINDAEIDMDLSTNDLIVDGQKMSFLPPDIPEEIATLMSVSTLIAERASESGGSPTFRSYLRNGTRTVETDDYPCEAFFKYGLHYETPTTGDAVQAIFNNDPATGVTWSAKPPDRLATTEFGFKATSVANGIMVTQLAIEVLYRPLTRGVGPAIGGRPGTIIYPLFFDSFDTPGADNNESHGRYYQQLQGRAGTSVGTNGSLACIVGGGGSNLLLNWGSPDALLRMSNKTSFHGIWVNMNGVTLIDDFIVFSWNYVPASPDGFSMVRLVIDTNRHLKLLSDLSSFSGGVTTIQTSEEALDANGLNHVEVKVGVNSGPASHKNGWARVWLWKGGVRTLVISQDDIALGIASIDFVEIMNQSESHNPNGDGILFDDLVTYVTDSLNRDASINPCRAGLMLPTAAGTYHDSTPHDPAVLRSGDLTDDTASDKNVFSLSGQKDSYHLDAPASSATSIIAIQPVWQVSGSDISQPSGATYKVGVLAAGTLMLSPTYGPIPTWPIPRSNPATAKDQMRRFVLRKNLNTGVAWTKADITAIEAVYKQINNGSGDSWLKLLGVEYLYAWHP